MRQGSPALWRRRSPASSSLTATACITLFLPFLFLLALAPRLASASIPDTDSPEVAPILPADDESLLAAIQNGGDAAAGLEAAESAMYEPEFDSFDRGILGRAPAGVTGLANNAPMQLNVPSGTTQYFVFEKSAIFARGAEIEDEYEEEDLDSMELRRRSPAEEDDDDDDEDKGVTNNASSSSGNSTRTVYLSANTCMQPQPVSSGTTTNVQAPQLTLYVSSSQQNTSPGPQGNSKQQTAYPFMEGAVMVSLNATDDVYIGVSAPNVSTTQLSGTYNMEVAASIDGWYHSYDTQSDANLIWVDSDSAAALLITHNLTDVNTSASVEEEVMSREPYVMFAQNLNDSSINGVKMSYCGLQTYAQIAATNNGKFTSMVASGMTRRGLGNLPKQQFYFSGLNSSSSYLGILAELPNNGTQAVGAAVKGGGGHVSRATRFETKSSNNNCEVVFNLTFCNETAYAVPSNPTRFANVADLARAYDEYASKMYDMFTKALAQIPCEAPLTQRYSLVRNCDNCSAAYKNWLCSVAMPRCSDFSENEEWLMPRALSQPFPMTGRMLSKDELELYPNTTAYNSSRNPFIDDTIRPGPYKEVLPCDDLCYNLVQSCPSSLGFSCPLPGQIGFNTSYGKRKPEDDNGSVTCNYPGSAHFFSSGPRQVQVSWVACMLSFVVAAVAVAA